MLSRLSNEIGFDLQHLVDGARCVARRDDSPLFFPYWPVKKDNTVATHYIPKCIFLLLCHKIGDICWDWTELSDRIRISHHGH